MEYMRVAQAAEQWGISDRRVRILCQKGKIEGVIQKGRSYLIPYNAVKPIDGRTLRHKAVSEQYLSLFSRIDSIKEQLSQHHPLTVSELQRLQEEFLVEYTYNSNAIEGNTLPNTYLGESISNLSRDIISIVNWMIGEMFYKHGLQRCTKGTL